MKSAGWQIEVPEQTSYISIDDIGVKHRTAEEAKTGTYVWNTTADIATTGGFHIVTDIGMKKTFLFVLAYLLKNDLLADRTLVFFTDGARSIFTNMVGIFSFHPYTVIWD